MKVIKRYNQHRRDLTIDMECENCKELLTYEDAYDDNNFWENVVPYWKCLKCGKSTKDLKLKTQKIQTKYPEGFQI